MDSIPRHLGIIMDGNGRWAQKRGQERTQGHLRGIEVVRTITEHASRSGVQYLTLYAFSSENWKRPQAEVQFLNQALRSYLESELPTMQRNNIRFEAMGRLERFGQDVQDRIAATRLATANNTGMCLVLAISYGGHQELIDATRAIVRDVQAGRLSEAELAADDDILMRYAYLPELGHCDCIIRTSGEQRLSNFLTLQSAYAELIFTPVLWPDFTTEDFDQLMQEFAQRQRRFGQ